MSGFPKDGLHRDNVLISGGTIRKLSYLALIIGAGRGKQITCFVDEKNDHSAH